ncbi:hypothetical protein scyTo_0022969, partial [Scyliorhinus torazame]|nr:hypothetical protein [Scyliorhinus torazame]
LSETEKPEYVIIPELVEVEEPGPVQGPGKHSVLVFLNHLRDEP